MKEIELVETREELFHEKDRENRHRNNGTNKNREKSSQTEKP